MRLLSSAVFGLCLCGLLLAEPETAEARKKPLRWPEAPRPVASYSVRTEPFDGSSFLIGTISVAGAVWDTRIPAAWLPVKDSSRYSIAFVPTNRAPLRLGIASFGADEFLPSIEDETWDRYLAGLQEAHDDQCEILAQTSATVAGSRWVPVLGVRTRSIEIRYPLENGTFGGEIQVFAFCKDRVVVFVLSGPYKVVAANAKQFFSTLGSIMPRESKS